MTNLSLIGLVAILALSIVTIYLFPSYPKTTKCFDCGVKVNPNRYTMDLMDSSGEVKERPLCRYHINKRLLKKDI